MPAGFEVFNSNGVKIIDNLSPCVALAQKTSITAWTGTAGDLGSINTVTVSYVGNANSVPVPVVYANPAVHGANFVIGIMSQTRSGNTWTYKIGMAYDEGTTQPSPSGSVFFLVYDRPSYVAGSSGTGIQIFDSSGLIIFAGPTSPTNGAILKPAGLANTTLPSSPKYGAIASYLKIENIYDYSENTDLTWTLTVREYAYGARMTATGILTDEALSATLFQSGSGGGGGGGDFFYGVNQDPVAANITGTV